MTIVTGMVLICSFYAYAPEFNRSGKVEIKNVEATTLFQEGDKMLVSYRFQENESIGFLSDGSVNKYEMEDIADLQARCTKKKK